jgi:hypothetical protein
MHIYIALRTLQDLSRHVELILRLIAEHWHPHVVAAGAAESIEDY